MRRPPRARPRAFTLVEVLVAVVIAAGVAGASLVAISQSVRARDASAQRQQAFSRASAAVARIAQDAAAIVRTGDLFDARLLLADASSSNSPTDELLLFCASERPLRAAADQPEGGIYEVQYRLQSPPDDRAAGLILWRRADPIPDDVTDGGGIAAPIVPGLRSLSIEAFDGSAWQPTWDSDLSGYPYALRITVSATDDQSRRTVVARRTVAFDRTPLPYTTVDSAGGQTGGAEPTTPSSTGSTTTPTTGGTGAGSTGGSGGGGSGEPR